MEIGVYAMELMTTTPECLNVSHEEQFRKWKYSTAGLRV
jgi:hypothetical protein